MSTFADEEEAVARANEGCFGLNFSVWARDTAGGRRLAGQRLWARLMTLGLRVLSRIPGVR